MSNADGMQVEKRLRVLEDRLEILNLLAGSPLSSDIASEAYWEALYAPGAEMDRGAGQAAANRSQIMAMVRGPDQASAIASGMAHLAGLPHIRIDGDRAVATGYLQVLVTDPAARDVDLPGKGARAALATYHLTVNRWELARTAAGWQVTRRVIHALGTEEALELVRRGIDSAD